MIAVALLTAMLAAPPSTCPDDDSAEDLPRRAEARPRDFVKAGRHELSLLGGWSAGDLSDGALTYGAAWAYHASEVVGVEATVLRSRFASRAAADISEFSGGGQVLFVEPRDFWLGHGDLVITPVHAKMMVLREAVVHFDLAVQAGVGVHDDGVTRGPAYNLGLRADAFVGSWASLRLDLKSYVRRQEILASDRLTNDLVLLVGVGLWPW